MKGLHLKKSRNLNHSEGRYIYYSLSNYKTYFIFSNVAHNHLLLEIENTNYHQLTKNQDPAIHFKTS